MKKKESMNAVIGGVQYISDLYIGRGNRIIPDLDVMSNILVLAGNIGDPHSALLWDALDEWSKKFTLIFYVPGYFECFSSYSDPYAPQDIKDLYDGFHETKNKENTKEVDDKLLETFQSIHEYMEQKIKQKYTNIHYMRKNVEETASRIFIGCQWFTYYDDHQMKMVAPLSDPCLYIQNRKGNFLTAPESNVFFNKCHQWMRDQLDRLKHTNKQIMVITSTIPTYELLSFSKKKEVTSCVYTVETKHTLISYPISAWICGGTALKNISIVNDIPIAINGIGFPGERLIPSSLIAKKKEMNMYQSMLTAKLQQNFIGPKTY